MFLQFWILFMIVGLTLSMWIFYWAVKRGQFEEQERAKYLPLSNPPMNIKNNGVDNKKIKFVWSIELIALMIVVFLSLAMIIRMLFVVFHNL